MAKNKKNIQKIKVATRTQDNGDGGFTTYAYNNNNELVKDHPKCEGLKVGSDKFNTMRDEIINEVDSYENGYIGSDEIEVEVMTDGTLRLASPISFHAGQ